MPYFRYDITVARVPLNGEVVILSDGIIIRGGNDVEYPEYYHTSGQNIVIAKTKWYTPDNQQISSNRSLGSIVCRSAEQEEYYPPKE